METTLDTTDTFYVMMQAEYAYAVAAFEYYSIKIEEYPETDTMYKLYSDYITYWDNQCMHYVGIIGNDAALEITSMVIKDARTSNEKIVMLEMGWILRETTMNFKHYVATKKHPYC